MDDYTKPDYKNIALITVDMQNDFSLKGAVFEVAGTDKVIPNIVRILRKFREKNKLIVHVVRFYKEDGSNVDICGKYILKQ
jgi:nicotinamidase-related amidase